MYFLGPEHITYPLCIKYVQTSTPMIKEGIEPRINLQKYKIIPVELIQHHGITSPQSGAIPQLWTKFLIQTYHPLVLFLVTVYVMLCFIIIKSIT